jgi:PAS domain S-box-containing protein
VVRDEAAVMRDESGAPVHVTASLADVGESERTGEEAREGAEYLRSLLEISPTAIATVDLDANVTSWNPAAERLFGYAREEAIGRNIDDLVAVGEDVHQEAVGINREAARGKVQLITRRTRKDGTLVDVDLCAAPIVVAGETVGMLALYHDIGELQRQKQYFESLVDLSPTAVTIVDAEGRITLWNPAAEKLFGYTSAEAVGRDIDDLVANTEELREEATGYTSNASRGHLHAITRRTRKDGSLVDVELLAAPVRIRGSAIGAYAIYHDISDLVRARRDAEAATQAKSAFLATMSHEIRTPMNAVIGMTGLLLDTELDAEQREYAEIIRTSGDALLAIINDILDFSKIEAGKLELDRQPFDVRECVESALDLVAATAAEKGLDLAYLLDDHVPAAVVGDVTRVQQILVNLLTNAVKFTEEGEIVVSASGRPPLHFAVRDTGIGIPRDRMDLLFESFSQLDASTTRRYGGTGLGLAISSRLAELMGGRMWVESEVGEGSTFHFTILAEQAPVSALPPRPGRDGAELEGKRLLVVDDNETNRQVVARQSVAWGMEAADTGSPDEALKWIRRGDRFDVAALDLLMPEMDGIALAREIRRYRDAAELPLVLLTSLGRRTEELEAGIGFAAYLTKPVKAAQLRAALTAAVGGDAQARAVSQPEIDTHLGERLPLRILVAEDNVVNQQLALALLKKMGYRADVAATGVEALEALERRDYDVVLMDVQMPEMDGLEASRRIRARWPARGPRIVAVTASAMADDREICFAAGMDDYLSKPIRVDELVAALARARPADEPPVVDPAALARLAEVGDEPGFVPAMIDAFAEEAARLLRSLREAVAQGNAEDARRAAHSLKSDARTFGASELERLSLELETRAQGGSLDGATALVERIEAEYERVRTALEAAR